MGAEEKKNSNILLYVLITIVIAERSEEQATHRATFTFGVQTHIHMQKPFIFSHLVLAA